MSDTVNQPTATSRPNQSPRQGTYRFLIICALFMLAGISFLAWLGSPPARPVAGKPFPVAGIERLVNADEGLTTEQLLGQKTLVLLWSPEQENCREHLDNLNQIMRKLNGFRIVTIAYSKGNMAVEALQAHATEKLKHAELNWPTYADVSGKSTMEYALLMPFGSFGFPTIIVLDDQGRVITVNEGQSSEFWRELELSLSRLK